MNEETRDGFIFYKSFYEAIHELDFEDQCAVYEAIFEYQFNNSEPHLEGVKKAIWLLIKPQLDANNQRYENGKKGGAPTGNTNASKKENNQKQPKNNQKTTNGCFTKQPKTTEKQPKEKEKENVKEKVNDKVKDKEKEKEAETENEKETGSASAEKQSGSKVMRFYLDNINSMPTPREAEILESYEADTPEELILYAMEKAVENKGRSLRLYQGYTKQLEAERLFYSSRG